MDMEQRPSPPPEAEAVTRGHRHCATAHSGAAVAALISIRWDVLTPTDLLIASLSLRSLRRNRLHTRPSDHRLVTALRGTEDAVNAGAAQWFTDRAGGTDTVTTGLREAFHQISELLLISECLCDSHDDYDYDTLLHATLHDVREALTCYLTERTPGPHGIFADPGVETFDHLVRAHACVTRAALTFGP